MELYDLHCHIDLMPSMERFANEAAKTHIGILAVTTTPKAYVKEISVLHSFNNVKIGLGLHPQLVLERYSELSLIEKYIDSINYVGEIGLDFNNQFYASKEKQIDVFDNIIKWCSKKSGKVISIHAVRSTKSVLDILEKYRCTEDNKCIFHWFSGSFAQLQQAVEMKCLFSVNGAMLKSENGQMLIKNIPPESILIETDAPFVNEIINIKQLKKELIEIESALTSFFGINIIGLIHTKSKTLLSMD